MNSQIDEEPMLGYENWCNMGNIRPGSMYDRWMKHEEESNGRQTVKFVIFVQKWEVPGVANFTNQ